MTAEMKEMTEPSIHCLKTWPAYFRAIKDGRKKFEIRSTLDRVFNVGDALTLQEFDPTTSQYSGEMLTVRVTYLTDFGQAPGYVVMGIEEWNTPTLAAEVTRLTKELADVKAWQEEIRGAIDRSGMGIMRTSQGPTGTMIGYRPEVDAEHERRTLEVIHENVDLQCEVRRLKAQLTTLTASEKPKEESKV